MCGIVGFAGAKQAAPVLLDGLEKLEYRGYDSSGVAVVGSGGAIRVVKTVGRIKQLGALLGRDMPVGTVGIGHTRWATHGEPSDVNSHPHMSKSGRFAVVHNGIIENHAALRAELTGKGFDFVSDTDTEAIAHLLDLYYAGDVLECVAKATARLRGSYAICVLFTGTPDRIYAARQGSPLVLGYGDGENFIASDAPALLSRTRDFVFMHDGEFAVVSAQGIKLLDRCLSPVDRKPVRSDLDVASAEKCGYPHFMLKEIYAQPKALADTVEPRLRGDIVTLDGVAMSDEYIRALNGICIVGCGSAYHAGVAARYFFERILRLPVAVEHAGEYRYRMPVTGKQTLTVAISQSGETADTLAAIREAKRLGSRTLAIVNVPGSTASREADDVLYTRAGPEIAVATTKGYTTQIAALYLLGIYIAARRGADNALVSRLVNNVRKLPENADRVLKNSQNALFTELFAGRNDAFFMGRGMDFATALEGALKLKEISYIHAEAYPASELKHGTISLIEPGTPVVVISTDKALAPKTASAVREVNARGADVIAFVGDDTRAAADGTRGTFVLPPCDPLFSPVSATVALQLLAYRVAVERGCDIDKPRNLAKSVTVE